MFLGPSAEVSLREFVDVLLPYLTGMVNACLIQGHLPVSQTHAVVSPLLKKPGLDASDLSNYRPVSNLTFMLKVVERAVAEQLHEYLAVNKLLPRNQSAYRKYHSTETALLRVWSDAMMAADCRSVTMLGLIDHSAVFDCVDHTILLQRLQVSFGLEGTVLHLVPLLFVGPHTADRVLWADVGRSVGRPWCAVSLCAWAATVRALHGRASSTGRATRRHHAPVRRRMPTLP